ncbi:MAG: orotate phosphoribosyltransferase [Rhodospirillaceae bacterium]|nr:orotate phosphoribosyltransferase [Rhodospirillaceae bacterium]
MILSSSASIRLAQALAELGAVHIATEQPFFYTSGWASPVYIDVRMLMSDVPLRTEIMDLTADVLRDVISRQGINAVVGVENSGIAFAAWIAERLALPLLYLRKRPIGWGVRAQLEGRLPHQARVLLVDDVTTDGLSKIAAASALRQTGTQIDDTLVLMEFDVYPQTAVRFAEQTLNLHAMTNWADLHAALLKTGRLSSAQENRLSAFVANPVTWSIEHGGVGA